MSGKLTPEAERALAEAQGVARDLGVAATSQPGSETGKEKASPTISERAPATHLTAHRANPIRLKR